LEYGVVEPIENFRTGVLLKGGNTIVLNALLVECPILMTHFGVWFWTTPKNTQNLGPHPRATYALYNSIPSNNTNYPYYPSNNYLLYWFFMC
jgi:hypothetical protein